MELLEKMKTMPGMGDMSKIFSQMGIPGLGKGSKLNTGAMEANLNRNMKAAKIKERIRAKAEANTKAKAKEQSSQSTADISEYKPAYTDEELIKIFSTGEKVEKTPRGAKPPESNSSGKKKKGKK